MSTTQIALLAAGFAVIVTLILCYFGLKIAAERRAQDDEKENALQITLGA